MLALGLCLASAAEAQTYQVFFATPREEAAIRNAIDLAQPQVYPLAVVVLDREAYREAEKVYRAPKNRGEFVHLGMRRVYLLRPALHGANLRELITHALGHLETNSIAEADAEDAARRMRDVGLQYEDEFLPVIKKWVRDDRMARAMAHELAQIALDRQRLLPCEQLETDEEPKP